MMRLLRQLLRPPGPPGPLGPRRWRLVPPLVSGLLGKAEAIAVFYREDVLQFCGPYGWNGMTAVPIDPVVALSDYGAPWTGGGLHALPAAPDLQVTFPGSPPRQVPGDRLAGQWSFFDAGGTRIEFPLPGFRSPLLTVFRERALPQRTIKLLSAHIPPALATARLATAKLAEIREMTGPLGPNEVRCIAGDFNISAWDDVADATSYALLRNEGYAQHLNPRDRDAANPVGPHALAPGWPQKGYYATHGRKVGCEDSSEGADPWIDTGPDHVVQGYPGFGWVDRSRFDAIDNIFTRGAGPGAAASFTIANPITGSPYTAVPPPAGVATGSIGVQSRLAAPGVFALPLGVPEDPDGEEACMTFRDWDNYGKIHSLSDHLPVVIDV